MASSSPAGSRQASRSPRVTTAMPSDPFQGAVAAKRPRALDPAPVAASRVMDPAEVAAGLCDVHGLVVRDEAFAAQVADCVDSNAVLLDEVLGRLLAVEALVGQQGADALQLKDYTAQEDARIDNTLRMELGAMQQQLLAHDAELKGKLATEADKVASKLTSFEDVLTRLQLAAIAPTLSPDGSALGGEVRGVEHPSIAALDGVRVAISALEIEARASADRVSGVKASADSTLQKLLSVNGDLDGVKSNIGQLVAAFTAFKAQPAPQDASAFAAGRGVDPMQAGTTWDGVHLGGQPLGPAASSFHMGTPPHHPHEPRDKKFQL